MRIRVEDAMSHYTINPMTSHETGAEIIGLDLSRPVSSEVKKQINADFAKYHVLAFRGQRDRFGMDGPGFHLLGDAELFDGSRCDDSASPSE
jgi:alpha-ketoglutarate-dependent taurine dioxygenase